MYISGSFIHSFIYFSEWKALALCFSMQSDRSQRLMRQVTFAHSYINCGEANPSITNTHSDTVGTAICGHLPFRHWVSCPRTNWCVDGRGRESYRLSLKVEELLYLLGNIEAELGGNVARPSDFETSSKMTRLQKKIFVFLSEAAILFTVVLFPQILFVIAGCLCLALELDSFLLFEILYCSVFGRSLVQYPLLRKWDVRLFIIRLCRSVSSKSVLGQVVKCISLFCRTAQNCVQEMFQFSMCIDHRLVAKWVVKDLGLKMRGFARCLLLICGGPDGWLRKKCRGTLTPPLFSFTLFKKGR